MCYSVWGVFQRNGMMLFTVEVLRYTGSTLFFCSHSLAMYSEEMIVIKDSHWWSSCVVLSQSELSSWHHYPVASETLVAWHFTAQLIGFNILNKKLSKSYFCERLCLDGIQNNDLDGLNHLHQHTQSFTVPNHFLYHYIYSHLFLLLLHLFGFSMFSEDV